VTTLVQNSWTLATFIALLWLGQGCTRDVSADPDFLGRMHIGQVYVLKDDMFIWNVNAFRPWFDPAESPVTLRLTWPGHESHVSNWEAKMPTIAEYKSSGKPGGICGIMPKGTLLSLDRIDYENRIDTEESKYLFKVIDGIDCGQTFDLADIMLPLPPNRPRYLIFEPNPECMQRIP
jgi:hypothetical protein